MQLRLRSSLLGLALLAGALAPAAVSGVACASSSAALVVDTGRNTYTYCVELGGSSVNGVQLIQRAGSQHGLQYKLGHGGGAVCMLANVGENGNDCFGEDYFWGYWQDDDSGGWSWSSTGAANVTIRAGDINGWSWGTGDNGSSHPPPPAITYESVCTGAPAPEPPKEPDRPKDKGPGGDGEPKKKDSGPVGGGSGGNTSGGNTSGGGESGGGTPGSGASGGGGEVASNDSEVTGDKPLEGDREDKRDEGDEKGERKERGEESTQELADAPSPSPEETPVTVADPAGARAPEAGFPVVALVALGLTAALGALGALLARRRRQAGG